MDQLMFSSEDAPANHSAWPVSEKEWPILVATSPSSFLALLTTYAPASFFTRTSPVSYRRGQMTRTVRRREMTREEVENYLEDFSEEEIQELDTRMLYKQTILTPSSVDLKNSGTAWRGQFLTLNILAYRNGGSASSLSRILETCALPTRFSLTPTACLGILRRAERRGKVLLERLRLALESVATTLKN